MDGVALVPHGMKTTAAGANISQGIQDMIANATLAFVRLNTGFATVDATVSSIDIVYTCTRRNLGITYAATFAVLLFMSAIGIFCMVNNGESSSNKLKSSKLLVAMRNPELDSVAEVVAGENAAHANRVQLKLGESGPAGDRVFGVHK
ncbi:hypothetical protein C8R43DRAFT_940362 [Mycena crocata]|nr:hypothetical protein C8R43DRAFT_940362 [Mycena crocata]